MKSKELKKIGGKYFRDFAKRYGFKFIKPTVMARIDTDVLQIINTNLLSDRIYCNIAIQPLYIPQSFFVLGMGNRLEHLKNSGPIDWGYGEDSDKIENDFKEIIHLLETIAEPWLKSTGNPKGIIKFTENIDNVDILTAPYHPLVQNLHLAYSYLYVGDIRKAKKPFNNLIEMYKGDQRGWVVDQNVMIGEMLNLMNKGPEFVREKLNENIKFTKEHLKIVD